MARGALAVRLRHRFLGDVKPLHRDLPGLLTFAQVAGHALVAASAAAGAESLHGTAAYLPAVVGAAFVIGSRFRAFGNMVHECSHRTAFRNARVNDALGHFLSFFDFTDFVQYRYEHNSHHAHLGDPTRDLDFAQRRDLFASRSRFVLQHVLKPLTLFHVPRYIAPVLWTKNDSPAVRLARLAFMATLLALAQFVIGWKSFALYYLLPYATTYQIFRYWSDAADHAGVNQSEDELHRSRNHVFWGPINWLLFPRSDQYHLVHHLFPVLPTRHLRRVHDMLMTEPAYAKMNHSGAQLVALDTE